jgi:glycosyltransferase involved in cell wall biosynthesis
MGRLSYEKSIDVVVETFVKVLKKLPDARLMLVGDGPEKSKLENLCHKLGIKDKVIFTGFIEGEKLAESLQVNDVFVTASKSENMPLSLLEAKASGLPIVCVSEKGLKELVKDGVSGFLVPVNDKIAMTDAVLKILTDKKLRIKISTASRQEAEKYSSESISKMLEDIYKNHGK